MNELLYDPINNSLFEEFDNKLKKQSKIRKEDDFYTYIKGGLKMKRKRKKNIMYKMMISESLKIKYITMSLI